MSKVGNFKKKKKAKQKNVSTTKPLGKIEGQEKPRRENSEFPEVGQMEKEGALVSAGQAMQQWQPPSRPALGNRS